MVSRLKETLERLKVSQRELARRTGIDPVRINLIVNKGIDIRGSTAEKIAKALDVSIEEVISESVQQKS